MSDVFISYARSTEAQAIEIAEALRRLGYRVWRDDEIPANRAYAEVIAERLAAAKAVVVIWSAEAARSHWVFSEANRAREDGKLVQLSVDGARLPMPFDSLQCADFHGRSGGDGSPGWKQVVDAIAGLVAADGPRPQAAPQAAARKLAICVLPFANMSGDPEQEYFSDGISEDIITDLSQVSALRVTSRNSAFTFKGRNVELPEVGRKLGVSHVLEGSIRKAGNRVRITAQLIEAVTDTHLWAQRWDRDLTDIFALQDEISRAIVTALKIKLLPAERRAIARRGTDSPEAYDLFLMARKLHHSANWSVQTAEARLSLCQRAVAIDPDYAQAWASLAWVQASLFHRYGQANDAGLAANERALALDPNLAEAHALKARQLRRAGRRDEAFAELDVALRLDPESFDVNDMAGFINYHEGRYAEAARHFEACVAASETDFTTCGLLQSSLAALGDMDGARRAAQMTFDRVEKALAEDPSNGTAISSGVFALATLGEREKAREWMERALLLDPDNQLMRYNFACALSLHLGDVEGALALLEPALSGDFVNLESARRDPDLDPLRGDPRFQAMMARAEAREAAAKS